MKSRMILLLVSFSLMFSITLLAGDLGDHHFALEAGWISFTDSDIKDADVDSDLFLGLKGYTQVYPRVYLGGELGYANPSEKGLELTYIPVEFNVKYLFEELAPNVYADLGAGLSYNYAKFEVNGHKDNDWMFGGQVFGNLNYVVTNDIFLGLNGKYQITEDFDDGDSDLSNWRIGAQIGIMF